MSLATLEHSAAGPRIHHRDAVSKRCAQRRGRFGHRVVIRTGIAFLALLAAPSPGVGQVKIEPGWCNQHPEELPWVAVPPPTSPRPYVLTISGYAGNNPAGGPAALTYFVTTAAGQGVYFMSSVGTRTPLAPLKALPCSAADPRDCRFELTLPASVVGYVGRLGDLEFELHGVVTERTPVEWLTTGLVVRAQTPLKQWDPLDIPRSARIGGTTSKRTLEFKGRFEGCPPPVLSAKALWWGPPLAGSTIPFTSRFDALSSASGPGGYTLWIQEADLSQRPLGIARQPDDIQVGVLGAGGDMQLPIRRPLEFTTALQPNRIDLGFKKCWYLVKAKYTGGFPITHIYTGPVGAEPAVDARWLSQRLARGALLQMEIPARPALLAAQSQSPARRVSVFIEQLGRPTVEMKIPVVNLPLNLNDALPSGGCDYSAPSTLPSR